jgi:hypothetical protein
MASIRAEKSDEEEETRGDKRRQEEREQVATDRRAISWCP